LYPNCETLHQILKVSLGNGNVAARIVQMLDELALQLDERIRHADHPLDGR
jgi:hypothetical protein